MIKMIKRMILKMKLLLNKNELKHSFLFTAILSKLEIKISDNASTFVNYSYGVFMLSLIALLCFINVLFYLIVYIIIQQKDYETKYPKLKRVINYYKNMNLIVAIIESVLCLICLLVLTLSSLVLISKFHG